MRRRNSTIQFVVDQDLHSVCAIQIAVDTKRDISTLIDRPLVRELESRKVARRTVRVIARDVECEISSAGDGGARQNDGV